MKTIYLLLFSALLLSSCRVTRERCIQLYPPPPADTSTSTAIIYRETAHDTFLTTKMDSSWISLLIDCNGENEALITQLQQRDGSIANIKRTITKNNKGLKLVFECRCDSQAIYFTWKERDTVQTKTSTIIKHYPVPAEIKLTWWQNTKLEFGGYAMALIAAFLALKLGVWILKAYTQFQIPFIRKL